MAAMSFKGELCLLVGTNATKGRENEAFLTMADIEASERS